MSARLQFLSKSRIEKLEELKNLEEKSKVECNDRSVSPNNI